MEDIYNQLQKLGFSQYESKAYVTLLKHSSITGYEVSKRSGVPRSMIYEVLGKLIDKGAAYIVPSEPVKYSPVPAKEMLERVKNNFVETVDYLEDHLHTLERKPDIDVVVHIDGYDQVIRELKDIVSKSEKDLWLSVWESQFEIFKDAVDQAVENGVCVQSLLFGDEDKKLGATFHHNYMPPEVIKERIGGQLTIAVRDDEEVIIANFMDDFSPWAVKTKNPALVLVATEYIRHDIMIEEITREFGADKLDKLWRNHRDLYQVVTGKRFSQ